MKRLFSLLFLSAIGTAASVSLFVMNSATLSFSDVRSLAASVFFVESATPEALTRKYKNAVAGSGKIRILVVPGHDNENWGTEFQGIREADMTAAVGKELTRFLSKDPVYEPLLARNEYGYAEGFTTYMEDERKNILSFLSEKKKIMNDLARSGEVRFSPGVRHNNAPSRVAEILYGINRFANSHGVDIVLHLHFNDYPGRKSNQAGRYTGFSIYIPEKQFSNARGSRSVAQSIFDQLSEYYAASNLPLEDAGVVEDQELIAVGAYNTLDPASVLIEYGYIYEQKFLSDEVREAMMKELAYQTYRGLNRFFGKYGEPFEKYPTTFLPHNFEDTLSVGDTGKPVLALQMALKLENIYPPQGESKRTCPVTGSFGPCTKSAVKNFQSKNDLPQSGVVGTQTILKLNEKFR